MDQTPINDYSVGFISLIKFDLASGWTATLLSWVIILQALYEQAGAGNPVTEMGHVSVGSNYLGITLLYQHLTCVLSSYNLIRE